MDSDQRELYERGVADAAHNNLNIFYYQHYYYYRKGYDELRRSQRRRSRWTLMLLSGGMLTLLAVACMYLSKHLHLRPQLTNPQWNPHAQQYRLRRWLARVRPSRWKSCRRCMLPPPMPRSMPMY